MIKIPNYEIVENVKHVDHVDPDQTYENFKVEGNFEINDKKGKFTFERSSNEDHSGCTCEIIEGDLTDDEHDQVVEYIEEGAALSHSNPLFHEPHE